jgi:dihydrofolate synthase/folylpolyglutamate synthase
MSLNRPRDDGDRPSLRDRDPRAPGAHPGEPGVGPDLAPPFTAGDEPTRWLFSLNRFGIRPGLQRIEGLLADLGHPERDLRTLVVAGTNGKGSTTRILATLLQAAGHRVATYTSPHLLNVHERILIDDRAVDATGFADRVTAIRPLTEKHEASWFETLTALAVAIARDEGVDYLCCETGLGGRLDASNALPAVATLLTTVGLDHQRILGETRAEIAAEKLGLLKPDVPLFTGVDDELRGQAFGAAVAAGSPCYFLDELARWPDGPLPPGATWELTLRERVLAGLPDPGTPGMRRNVALALLALAELETSRGAPLLPADPAAALGNLFLPGRYQRVLSGPDVIFDTAHNDQALRNALATFSRAPCRGRRVVLFGAMYDKGLDAATGRLLGACDHVVGVPVSLPRSRTPDELHGLFADAGLEPGGPDGLWRDRATVFPAMGPGLRDVAAGLRTEDALLVTGSCFTVAEVLHRLGFDELVETRNVRAAGDLLAGLAAGEDPRRKDGP